MPTTTPTAAELLNAALLDLERVTSQVIQHNAGRMQHPLIRDWLTGGGAEPSSRKVCIVRTAPAARIRLQIERGKPITIADTSKAIVTMQRGLARALRREAGSPLGAAGEPGRLLTRPSGSVLMCFCVFVFQRRTTP